MGEKALTVATDNVEDKIYEQIIETIGNWGYRKIKDFIIYRIKWEGKNV